MDALNPVLAMNRDDDFEMSIPIRLLHDLADHCETEWSRHTLMVGEQLMFITSDNNTDIKVFLGEYGTEEYHCTISYGTEEYHCTISYGTEGYHCTISLADPDAITKLKAIIEKYYVPYECDQ